MEDFAKAIPYISVVIAAAGFWLAYRSGRRVEKKDNAQDTQQLTRIEVMLDTVNKTTNDINTEIRAIKGDLGNLQTRMTRMEVRHEMEERGNTNER